MAVKGERGFLLLETVVAVAVLVAVLGITFQVLQFTFKLQAASIANANLSQNQTMVMQRINQQVTIYSRSAVIESAGGMLVLNDIAGNRIVSFYKGNEADGVATLYMSTQIPPEVSGINQLTDPHNVEVLDFYVYKINNKKLRISLQLRDKVSGKISEYTELISMLNGEVL